MSKAKEVGKDNTKKKNVETQKNYFKNYVILVAIFGCCIALTLYFCKWYDVYKDYQKEIPVIRDSLYEITSEDLEHYVADNSRVIIYMCESLNDDCRSFEKDFKKYIHKNDITDQVIYLNLTGVDIDEFVRDFNNSYNFNRKLNGNYPSFAVFQDGKLISILQESKNKKLSISTVKHFLDLYLEEEEMEEEINIEGEEA